MSYRDRLPGWMLAKIAANSEDAHIEFELSREEGFESSGYDDNLTQAGYRIFAHFTGFHSGAANPAAWRAYCEAAQIYCTVTVTMPIGEVIVDDDTQTVVVQRTEQGFKWLSGPLSEDSSEESTVDMSVGRRERPGVVEPERPSPSPERPTPAPERPTPAPERDRNRSSG